MSVLIDPTVSSALSLAGTSNNPIVAYDNAADDGALSTGIGVEVEAAALAGTGTTYDAWIATPQILPASVALFVGGEESLPIDLIFNNDGTSLYVTGASGDDVNEYPLPTPYDISSYTSGTTVALDVSVEESSPRGMLFNDDGTSFYITGTSSAAIHEYPLPTPYDISSYTSGTSVALDVSVEESAPHAMLYNDDGTSLYVLGTSGADVNEYPLPTPYDISSYTSGTSVALFVGGEESVPASMIFNDDGTSLYVLGTSGADVNEYPLPTPYDISSYTSGTSVALFVGGEEPAPRGMRFNGDGTSLYVIGTTNDNINEYPLPLAYDISSRTNGPVSLDLILSSPQSLSIGAIAAHNLGTIGATVSMQYSTDSGVSWIDSGAGSVTPTDDQAVVFYFDAVSATHWRFNITVAASNNVEIAVALFSNPITIGQRIYQGYAPPITPNVVELQSNVSEGGNLLGSATVRKGSRASAGLTHIEPTFLRGATWTSFQAHFNGGGGFFWLWRPTKYGDAFYAWRDGGVIAPTNSGPKDYMSFELGMRLYDQP